MKQTITLSMLALTAVLSAPRTVEASKIDMTSWLLTGTDKVVVPKAAPVTRTVDAAAAMNFTVNPSAQFFCPIPGAFLSGTCLDDKPKGPRHYKLTIDPAAVNAINLRLSDLLATLRAASDVVVKHTSVKVSGNFDKALQTIVFNVKVAMNATATIHGKLKTFKVTEAGKYKGDRLP